MSVSIVSKFVYVSVNVSISGSTYQKVSGRVSSFSLSLASALHQSANSTTFIASALVLKFSAFLEVNLTCEKNV